MLRSWFFTDKLFLQNNFLNGTIPTELGLATNLGKLLVALARLKVTMITHPSSQSCYEQLQKIFTSATIALRGQFQTNSCRCLISVSTRKLNGVLHVLWWWSLTHQHRFSRQNTWHCIIIRSLPRFLRNSASRLPWVSRYSAVVVLRCNVLVPEVLILFSLFTNAEEVRLYANFLTGMVPTQLMQLPSLGKSMHRTMFQPHHWRPSQPYVSIMQIFWDQQKYSICIIIHWPVPSSLEAPVL
jgi:hypothetical protein